MFRFVLLAALLSCKAADDSSSKLPSNDSTEAKCEAGGPTALTIATEDNLKLEADYYPSGQNGGPGVVLLHMIPPHHDKSNYTTEFIAALTGAGYTVLNVNRRGAGASEGDAVAAYEGDKGRLDAVAAHAFLTESACAVPAGSIAFVGASNGTTTALDFAVAAVEDDRPAALVFLSPGEYTENQNKLADVAATLSPLPLFLGYPESERDWPEAARAVDTGAWTFREYAAGKHGTNLFSTHPDSIGHIADFLKANLPANG